MVSSTSMFTACRTACMPASPARNTSSSVPGGNRTAKLAAIREAQARGQPSLVGTVSTGNLTLLPDGSVTYTPPANFSGTATFGYTLSDGIATATVATTIVETKTISATVNGNAITQTALLYVIEPIFEHSFAEQSYGF